MPIQSCTWNKAIVAEAGVELIEVARVRISVGNGQLAVLGDLRAADRLLVDWARHDCSHGRLEVEVAFLDGYVFRGCYDYRACRRGRPSVSQFVQRALQELSAHQCATRSSARAEFSRYAVESW